MIINEQQKFQNDQAGCVLLFQALKGQNRASQTTTERKYQGHRRACFVEKLGSLDRIEGRKDESDMERICGRERGERTLSVFK